MRRAKIVATLGPASSDVETIEKLIKAGLNVARVNMSHGTHEGQAKLITNIREASKRCGQEVGVLLDLQGPKIRVDKLPEPLELKADDEWVIGESSLAKNLGKNFIPTVYKDLAKDCRPGCRILFDDGLIVAEAIGPEGEGYKIKVKVGGILKSNKGINLPDVNVSAPSFTDKDKEDLRFGLSNDVDFIAMSFVRRKEDVQQVKFLLHKLRKNIPVISKIEKPEAVENLEEILDVTDVIMVARGDMGVEVGNHLVPTIQKEIISACNKRGKPVITATQMLESMITNSTPTRAEASDVANAVWDGTDAVMLSGETAAGKYPVEAVKMMDQIVREAEKKPKERPLLRHIDLSSVNASTMVAASLIAEKVNAKMILSVTQSGNSCLKISRFRPTVSVLGVTNDIAVVRRLCLYWGVDGYLLENYNEDDELIEHAVIQEIKEKYQLNRGDKIVITRGDGKFFSQGTSNSVRVEILKDIPSVAGGSEGLEIAEFRRGRIHLDTAICASCQNCITVCPHDIWEVDPTEGNRTRINLKNANSCELDEECVQVCPTGAIEIIPQDF